MKIDFVSIESPALVGRLLDEKNPCSYTLGNEMHSLMENFLKELSEKEKICLEVVSKTHPISLSVDDLSNDWECSRQTIYNYANKAKRFLQKRIEETTR